MDDIQEIHSHQHAIAQCQQYIHQHLSKASIYYTDSTDSASANLRLQNNNDTDISNKTALKDYCLRVLQQNLQDNPNKHKHLIVLTKDDQKIKIDHAPSLDITTLLIPLPEDHEGVPHQVL